MILCYTLNMVEDRQMWANWARILQWWGLKEPIASFLESAGALNVILAQVVYISQPLFSGVVNPGSLDNFAQVLEDPATRTEFVSYLKEAPISGSST